MPTATSFSALGKGNGFPFCSGAVNVNNSPDGNPYTHWITLGGTIKGGGPPTQSEIDLSLKNAMKLFWNYNGHTATDSTIRNDSLRSFTNLTIDIDEEEYKIPSEGRSLVPFPFFSNPKSRVCAGNGWTDLYQLALLDPTEPDSTLLGELNYFQVSNYIYFFNSRVLMYIIKMYDGSTDNEDNFLGYGLGPYSLFTFLFGDTFVVSSLFYAGDPGINPENSSFGDTEAVYEYLTLDREDNIPIVARAWGREPSDTITITQEPSDSRLPEGLSATFTRANQHPQGLHRGEHTLQNRDFDFYTY
tara:strand:+ start:91 stop:996 length:906 start_codon:yes stop_codon:yes gene_type:complete